MYIHSANFIKKGYFKIIIAGNTLPVCQHFLLHSRVKLQHNPFGSSNPKPILLSTFNGLLIRQSRFQTVKLILFLTSTKCQGTKWSGRWGSCHQDRRHRASRALKHLSLCPENRHQLPSLYLAYRINLATHIVTVSSEKSFPPVMHTWEEKKIKLILLLCLQNNIHQKKPKVLEILKQESASPFSALQAKHTNKITFSISSLPFVVVVKFQQNPFRHIRMLQRHN